MIEVKELKLGGGGGGLEPKIPQLPPKRSLNAPNPSRA